jgi:hypothetical protein
MSVRLLVSLTTLSLVDCLRSRTVTTLGGNPSASCAGKWSNGVGTNACFSFPATRVGPSSDEPAGVYVAGLATDASGNVFIVDPGFGAVRVMTPAGAVSTWAGSLIGEQGFRDAPSAFFARFREPTGIAVLPTGKIFVADSGNHIIRIVAQAANAFAAGAVSTLAGTREEWGFNNGAGLSAKFHRPTGLVLRPACDGNSACIALLFVADTNNHAVRAVRYDEPGAETSCVAGALCDDRCFVCRPCDSGEDPQEIIAPSEAGKRDATRCGGDCIFRVRCCDNVEGAEPRLFGLGSFLE